MVGRSLFALLLLAFLVVADEAAALLGEATAPAGESTVANGSSSAGPDTSTASSTANSTASETPAPSTEKATTSTPTAEPTTAASPDPTTAKSTTTTTTTVPTTSTATTEPEPTSTTVKSTSASASSPTMPSSTVKTSSSSPQTTTTEDPPSTSLYQMSTQQICDKSRREYSFPTFVKKMNVDKRKQSRKTMAYFAGALYTIHGIFVIYILSLHFHSLFRRSGSAPTHVNTSVPSARVGEMSEQAPPSLVMEPIQT